MKVSSEVYRVLKPDGIFGNNTKNAVINFQQNNGLTADGIVGPLTTNKIKSYDYQSRP